MARLYLAGGFFNACERLHFLFLEKHLKLLGHEVILPQREERRHIDEENFNLEAIVNDCRRDVLDPLNLVIANSDYAVGNNGSEIKLDLAFTAKGAAITYRTDIRTDSARELRERRIPREKRECFLHQPADFTEMRDVDEYYERLAFHISEFIDLVLRNSVGDSTKH